MTAYREQPSRFDAAAARALTASSENDWEREFHSSLEQKLLDVIITRIQAQCRFGTKRAVLDICNSMKFETNIRNVYATRRIIVMLELLGFSVTRTEQFPHIIHVTW